MKDVSTFFFFAFSSSVKETCSPSFTATVFRKGEIALFFYKCFSGYVCFEQTNCVARNTVLRCPHRHLKQRNVPFFWDFLLRYWVVVTQRVLILKDQWCNL
jgi:hypothetical protein